tara:strand:- start:1155 stop:1940 length:786 start_codon:yes stop_codon:yes gene_type:complete
MSADLEVVEVGLGEIRDRVKDLRRAADKSYWDLSVALHDVYAQSYYQSWGFESFQDWIETDLDFQYRRARYLVSIQDWFGKMKPSVQAWVSELGWTKAKELVGIVTDENAASWKRRLAGKSFKEIDSLIKSHKQKIKDDAASVDGGPSADAPAVEGEKAKKVSFMLFDVQKANVDMAIESAKAAANTTKPGHALDLICTEFLASTNGVSNLSSYLQKVEEATGLRLLAWDPARDTFPYGESVLDELSEDVDEEDAPDFEEN